MYTNENNKSEIKKNNIVIYIIFIVILISICVVFFLNRPKKTNPTPQIVVSFELKGEDITLNYKEEYIEPGYTCFEGNNDLTDVVETLSNVNSNEPGEYSIIYKCRNRALLRKVTVLEPSSYDIIIHYDYNKDYTNQDIVVSYTVSGETFLEVILPDGTISKELTGNITVTSNGVYRIKAYNTRGEEFVQEINIENIDREKPTGSCIATLKNNNTQIDVTASDNVNITKYEYYDNNKLLNSNDKNSYTTSSKTSNSIIVKVYDYAGNNNSLTCTIVDKRYQEPIKPQATDKIVFQTETDTLKAYIISKDNYYITRIWAKDPYSQLNKAASPDYGKILYRPVELVKQAMNNNGLQNKAIIGFNASGFYLKDTYDAASVRKYSLYDKTAVGTIVINNGQVFRNAYDKAVKQWYIMGINKDNKMVIFEDNVASTTEEIAQKQKWAQTVINSGIRNTFSFAGPVIQNGQKLTSFSSSMPDSSNNTPKGLQLICQINENNFALFTAKNVARNTAINAFLSMGCQTATNLDGGGSTSLFYKAKNEDKFTTVVGGGRELPEAGYFTE